MMHPILHINILMDEEAVLYICATVAFVAMCWAIARILTANKTNKVTQ